MKKYIFIIISLLAYITLYACDKQENLTNIPQENPIQETMQLKISIGEQIFLATLYDNISTKTFIKQLPLTLDMIELNGNEKYYNPKQNEKLPIENAKSGTINPGDLMVWDSNSRSLVLFYKTFENPYKYVRIAKINNTEGLEKALGKTNLPITFELIKQ